MASSSSSSNQKSFKYQVFLSFRGEDTRKTFVDHLYASLKQLGIRTFKDNEELEKGKKIDELFKAIEESRFFIIVFSKNYASSSWCLKEVTKIMECQDGDQRIAYPLFYNVEPSDIRYQTGPVETAIARHKSNEEIKKWEKALKGAGTLVGWDLKNIANGHEAEAIDLIVREISLKLPPIHLSKDENLVGMESRMQILESSLGVGLDDEVRMIGIKGMGGIGKTTLATAVFHKISYKFEGISFVENVREASKVQGGLLSLQKQVLRDVLREDRVNSFPEAISMMKDRMPSKKVLLVLDDVDDAKQLEALAGDWFKDGSRIIITTRDEQVLRAHGVNKDRIHNIKCLPDTEAVKLFSRYAFKRYNPDAGYEDLSSKVVEYAAGLPLTLKVLGSFLIGKEKAAWKDTLNKLETNPWKETRDILEISYDGLDDDEKQIFLDVACFMKGVLEEDAVRMLVSRGFNAVIGLTVLKERSLITISNQRLGMHDSIEELGRHIVRRENPSEPNKHSRLWIPKEIEELLSDVEVTEATATCISMRWLDVSPEVIMKGLGKLKNLRLLHIPRRYSHRPRDNWMFDEAGFLGKLKNLRLLQIFGRHSDRPRDNFPNSLRFLHWERYPGRYLPQTFRANNLVGLELPGSRITKLWESGERKVLEKLRFLDLRDSKLKSLELGMSSKLERLDLEGCHDLKEIHASARCLTMLVYLNLNGCSQFNSFSFIQQLESPELLPLPKLRVSVMSYPRKACEKLPKLSFRCYYYEEQASSLENSQNSVSLDLQPDTKLESLSGSILGIQHLRHLTFDGCIPELPNDLDQWANLEELKLVSTKIRCLPDSICMMKKLKSLDLQACRLLEKLPEDLGQLECLEKLFLIVCESLKEIPNSIRNMKRLRYFCLSFCIQVENLPEELGSLESLKLLDIKFTGIRHLPQSISSLEGLRITGSVAVLRSCASSTKIQTSRGETFCYIQAVHNTEAETGLENQLTEKIYSNRHESVAIDEIVKEISQNLRSIHLSKDERLVGMESRMQDLELSLGVGLDDEARMIGIKGMGGSGKTTLAMAIFKKVSSLFEASIFVEDVSEVSEKMGLRSLQQRVLRDAFRDDNMNYDQDAESTMKLRMPLKKVLLVLDNVNHIDQLEALAGDWFKDGSRIVITTRDEKVLLSHGVNGNWIHDVSLLSDEEAISLFSRYAFNRYIPDEGYEELSSQVVQYAAGLPLTIKVLGSHLCGESELVWRNALKRLKTIPLRETLEVLEISYNSLEDDHKEMFLDVACFFKGMMKEKAIRMLESCGFDARYGLMVLEEQSLITISNQRLDMHDRIEELGKDIVRQRHRHKPNKHSRLWIPKEIEELFSDDGVTEATATFISVKWSDLSPQIIMKALGKLKNLKFLHISGRDEGRLPDNWMFDEDNFPNTLRFLHWERYPGRSLPQTFRANSLVGLELPESRIRQLWESGERKVLRNLRFLDLSNSKLRTLEFWMTPNLESLNLEGCHDLTKIHAPSGCLERLVYLNILGCSQFSSFSFTQQLESLELFSLAKLEVFVDFLKEFQKYPHDNLPKLSFRCFYSEEQASSLKNSQRSVSLDLQPDTNLESVSRSFFGLQHLKHLTFHGCIRELPNDLDQLVNLEELNLVSTDIKCLPDSICKMKKLKSLKLQSCELLEELPRDLGQLECLEKLILRECKALKDIPNSICNMRRLKELDINYTGISHLPLNISSLDGLRIAGSEAVLQSCAAFITEIETTEDDETFCYIQAVDNTEAETGLENQFTDNYYI